MRGRNAQAICLGSFSVVSAGKSTSDNVIGGANRKILLTWLELGPTGTMQGTYPKINPYIRLIEGGYVHWGMSVGPSS